MNKYNSQAFTPKEIEKGVHSKFIKYLLEISAELEDSYLDIHITTDGYCTIVEWIDVANDAQLSKGAFEFVGSDEAIFKEVQFPDGTYEYVPSCEAEDRLNEWLKENPGWAKNTWGTWVKNI